MTIITNIIYMLIIITLADEYISELLFLIFYFFNNTPFSKKIQVFFSKNKNYFLSQYYSSLYFI